MDWKQTRGGGCLVLFALPFAAVGAFTGWLALSMVAGALEAGTWEETPARILSAELVESQGDDGSTWRVEATYEYTRDGFTYRGDRVSLTGFSDNVGSFHRDVYRELVAHRNSGEPFTAFVDPDHPERAILYRRLRWGLLGLQLVFALVFGGVGFGLMAAALVGRRIAAAEEELRDCHPHQPWRWKREWADGRVPAGSRLRWVGAGGFAAFWNLISLPLLLLIPRELESGNTAALVGLVFPLVGLGLAAWAVHAWLQWRRYGDSTFEMAPVPGILGGPVAGRVHTRMTERPESGLRATLSCIRKEAAGSGRNRRRGERVLWQDAVRIPREHLQHGPRGVVVPVEFPVPYELEPSAAANDVQDPVLWRLDLEADVPGVDYEASFEIPVFRTEASDPDFRREPDAQAVATGVDATALAHSGIRLTPLPAGGIRLDFGRARQPATALGLTLLALIWAAIVAVLFWSDAPVFFPIVFALFLPLLLWAVADLWLGSARIEAERGRLRFARGSLWQGRLRELSADEIAGIEPVRGLQAGRRRFHRIQLQETGGDTHVLATLVDDLGLARRIIGAIRTHLDPRGHRAR